MTTPFEDLWTAAKPVDPLRSEPAGGEGVDLWLIDLEAPVGEPDCLSDAEARRVERLIVPAKSRQLESSHVALRRILSSYSGEAPEDLRFVLGRHGKPALDPRRLEFNLSHSGSWASVAVAPSGMRLGVDIEVFEEDRRHTELVDRFFAEEERRWWRSLEEEERHRAFYRGWTAKEAYLKAWGTGLTVSSRSFVLDLAARPATLLRTEMSDDDGKGWRFWEAAVGGDAALTLCWRGGTVDSVRPLRYAVG